MAQERLNLSEERLLELEENFWVSKRGDFMRLGLGVRHNLTPGYPVLNFHDFGGKYYLAADEPAPHQDGYTQSRELTNAEIVTFVQVARRVAPEAEMTSKLVEEATKLLWSRADELKKQMDPLYEALRIVSPPDSESQY